MPPSWTFHLQPITDSTNDDAKVAARAGCPDRSIYLADVQRLGRGRLGRTWVTPAGSSLLFSLVLRRSLPPITLTAATSLSVVSALDALAGLAARVKWPNDVMVADQKVCGILTEVVGEPRNGCTVVGVGINVNLDPRAAGLPPRATSLSAQLGQPVSRPALLRDLLARLDRYLEMDDAALRRAVWDEWQRLLWRRHQAVRLDQDGTILWGVVEGLSAIGALRIRQPDGSVVDVATGDLLDADLGLPDG